jgi:type I restriction enzyme M protein
MPKKQAKKADQPQTTAQQLGSLIKSARDIMRKDKGLNGDLDRLPMLTWIMFLKFLDDLEQVEETRAAIGGKRYRTAIEPPYRWRDWAAKKDGITGDELIKFINNDEAVRPDGSKGAGLFAYLRALLGQNGDGRRDVIANVFRGIQNRMISGYLLRDVVNLIDGIHFNAAEEIHTLGHLYESMLREMRDTAGDSGEFYTPRPVVRFMVEVTDPRLGEVLLDPACGTGGFLSESYGHLEKQCKTVQDMKLLQEKSIFGGEAKPLPYMLAQMNLLLHGLKSPQIAYGNSLSGKLTEIGKRDRVDVILTNPPFGGEEEAGIRTNFPADKQTSETALLFLQLIMRKLRRPGDQLPSPVLGRGAGGEGALLPSPSGRGAANSLPSPTGRGAGGEGLLPGGRAAVVVPNGTLFGDGVCARIKHELLTEFNLHTIVRLPNGVFAPYTSIPTNLLFFDCSGPTKTIWYYEQPLPADRKNYTKTKPIQYEEFADCLKWWGKRKENGRAWKVKASDVIKLDADGNLLSVNLDIKNPSAEEALEHLPPEQLVESILAKEKRIIEIMGEIKKVLAGAGR